MKQTFTGVFIALMLLTPSISKAQVVDISAQSKAELIAEIQAKIADLMIQLIQQLQIELTQALAQNTTAINSVSTKVDTIVSNQAPVLGVVPPAPVPITVSLGTPVCDNPEGVRIPVIASGAFKSVVVSYNRLVQMATHNNVTQLLPDVPTIPSKVTAPSPQNYFSIWNYPWTYDMTGIAYDSNNNQIGSFSQTVTVDTSCRDATSDIVLPL